MARDHLQTLLPSILGQYQRAYGLRDVPLHVDKLRPMIEERGWVDRIVWEEFFYTSQHIVAQVQFFEGSLGVYAGDGDYARIQFSASLNFCWRRFAICKEMYHAIIDAKPATRVTKFDDLLRLSEMLVSGASALVQRFEAYTTEHMAEVLALETLFPLELRLQYEELYHADKISDRQLAERFRIPTDYARMGMYPSYLSHMRDIRSGTMVAF